MNIGMVLKYIHSSISILELDVTHQERKKNWTTGPPEAGSNRGGGGCQKGEKGPSISFSVTLAIGKNGTAFIVVQKFRERYHNAYSKNYLR